MRLIVGDAVAVRTVIRILIVGDPVRVRAVIGILVAGRTAAAGSIVRVIRDNGRIGLLLEVVLG